MLNVQATVALTEMKYQEVVESNDNLNNRNSELITQVNEMQRVMNELEQQHASAQRTFHEITRVSEIILVVSSSFRINVLRVITRLYALQQSKINIFLV